MLEIADLHGYYGKSHVLHGVKLHVNAGEIVCLLGRNGVGRSTTNAVVAASVTVLVVDFFVTRLLLSILF